MLFWDPLSILILLSLSLEAETTWRFCRHSVSVDETFISYFDLSLNLKLTSGVRHYLRDISRFLAYFFSPI